MSTPLLTPNIGQTAYNPFTNYSRFSYNCISYMIANNELIWKLLKYNNPDAWAASDLTYDEKVALIYKGQEDSSLYNVFLDTKQPDAVTNETTQVRISPFFATGINRTTGIVEINMMVFSHYKINHLSNYQTRIDTITGELLNLFNGADVGGLGLLFLDKMGDQGSKMSSTGQIPFGGKQIIFATKTA